MTTETAPRPPRGRRVETDEALTALLCGVSTVAILGIRAESHADRPAHYVPAAVQAAGYRILPVAVVDPGVPTILGEPVHRSLSAIGTPPDLIDVFRRPEDLATHLPDVLASRPRAVWLQSGIREPAFVEALLEAGIDVVSDRCLMVDVQRLGTRPTHRVDGGG